MRQYVIHYLMHPSVRAWGQAHPKEAIEATEEGKEVEGKIVAEEKESNASLASKTERSLGRRMAPAVS